MTGLISRLQTLSFSKKIFVVGLIVSAALNIFFAVSHFQQSTSFAKENITTQAKSFPFISKRIFVENQNDILVNFVNLRKQLYEYVDSQPNKTSIYFEYLPSGVSIGVNEKDSYLLASLLKVPIVMAVYKEVSLGNLDHNQAIVIKEEYLNDLFGDLWKKGAGTHLTLDEAIDLVLADSDNTAKNALLAQIPISRLEEVFDYLDIPKEGQEEGPVVTAKNYSSILRSLYLASYLPKEESNQILEKMTHAKHKDKLVAGVPAHIKVAHKIGTYDNGQNKEKNIYTDCGIVYAPLRPYILCLMTESDDATAAKNFSTISKLVYEYVTSTNK
jgi:beta-lactamase class A